jgi:hypothetical protein
MPRLLAVGGPRDGHRMFVDGDAREVSFAMSSSFLPSNEPTTVTYHRRTLANGDEVLVHDGVPDGVDLEQLHERARAKLERDGDWAEQD